ncbi:hypothetical protein N186_00195 [Thermofilum adornatum]|uniref:DUF4352 domain-containing protein n=3 Tax=Thermofilaceae TaxID=114378 RepID=S6A4S9_9CREN|nr:hypothetical protein N186_00195 [Thermofilum adornatum]
MEMNAVSPIVSALLLVIISVAASVLIYFWVTSFQGQVTQQAGTPKALGSCLKIEGIEVADRDTSGVAYRIWVKNCGSQTLHLDYVYLLDPSGNVYHSYPAGEWSLSPQDTQFLWLWVPIDKLRIGERTTVKVVTAEGIEAYYVFTPT